MKKTAPVAIALVATRAPRIEKFDDGFIEQLSENVRTVSGCFRYRFQFLLFSQNMVRFLGGDLRLSQRSEPCQFRIIAHPKSGHLKSCSDILSSAQSRSVGAV